MRVRPINTYVCVLIESQFMPHPDYSKLFFAYVCVLIDSQLEYFRFVCQILL
jgi:hypothetical protein